MSIQHYDMKEKEMEKEIQMTGKDERSEWVSPSVTDWDIESETQAGVGSVVDGGSYS